MQTTFERWFSKLRYNHEAQSYGYFVKPLTMNGTEYLNVYLQPDTVGWGYMGKLSIATKNLGLITTIYFMNNGTVYFTDHSGAILSPSGNLYGRPPNFPNAYDDLEDIINWWQQYLLSDAVHAVQLTNPAYLQRAYGRQTRRSKKR
jgi:hypothetical protein